MEKDWNEFSDQCPACGSRRIQPAFIMHYWKDYPLQFHDCGNCGASFANPMPSDDLISRGNNALVNLYQKGRTFEHEFRDARQAYLRGRVLAGRLRRWKKTGRLIEVGCYDGFLLAGIQDHCDWEVEGVEIAERPSQFARDRLGVRVRQGTLEGVGLESAAYDFVLCNDLIEHINHPREFLKEISRILKPAGRLQLITPNAKQDLAFARRAFKAGRFLNMVLNHVIYYTPLALRKALEVHGLRMKKLYCYDLRYTAKDMGWFGMGRMAKSEDVPAALSFSEVADEATDDLKAQWTDVRLKLLKSHPKTSAAYGFWREILPSVFRVKVPGKIALGHEIFALAEKTARP